MMLHSSSDASAIIHALRGDLVTGMCRCPCHDDTTPSLHVSYRNDKVLVHCHGPCSQERVVGYLKSRGLWPRSRAEQKSRTDWYLELEQKRAEEYSRLCRARGIVREAGYHGRDVSLVEKYLRGRRIEHVPSCALGLTVRQSRKLFGKSYPAMVFPILPAKDRPGTVGAHVTFLSRDGSTKLNTETPRRIYGFAKGGYVVVSKLDPNRRLIVGEGIETTLSVCQLTGLPGIAALSAGNLPKIVPPPCLEIIIAADNDDVGRDAAKQAAQIWTMAGFKVYIATAPDRGSDWNDALLDADTERERGKLREAIFDKAELVQPSAEVEALGMEQFMQLQFPSRTYLLKPWLTTTGLTMIDALPGHGKTWLALSIGYAVASGEELLGWAVERKGRVLYVDGELPGALLQARLRQLGLALPETQFRVLSRAQFELHGLSMLDLGTPEGRDYLDKFIEYHDIDLVILDSVTTLVRSGVENDIESWRAIQEWSLVHRAQGRAVIYLHHHGRSGNPRGTSGREVVLDARIKLRQETRTDDETVFKLEFPKTREFYGADAADRLIALTTRSGVVSWRQQSIAASNEQRVKALVDEGWVPADIARELNLTRGRVSQIMKGLGLKSKTKKSTTKRPQAKSEDVME
jgi:putative DNA primase/helicase